MEYGTFIEAYWWIVLSSVTKIVCMEIITVFFIILDRTMILPQSVDEKPLFSLHHNHIYSLSAICVERIENALYVYGVQICSQ